MKLKRNKKIALQLVLLLVMVSFSSIQTVSMGEASLQDNSLNSTRQLHPANDNSRSIKTTSKPMLSSNNITTVPATTDALETAPSITSVHQIWTASSSGSMDELSPEMISKLRNDVPFLAAYALRPRLVGASALQAPVTLPSVLAIGHDGQVSSDRLKMPSLDTSSSERSRIVVSGAGGSPAKTSARQQANQEVAAGSLVPKLGDFSEFNVETSSTSKSEHHHKRKTSLKRPNRAGSDSAAPDVDVEPSTFSRQTSKPGTGGASKSPSSSSSRQLAAAKRKRGTTSKSRKTKSIKGAGKSKRRLAAAGAASRKSGSERATRGKGSKTLASGRLSSNGKLPATTSVNKSVKRGRYLQEQSTTTLAMADETSGIEATKGGGDDGGVKGGSVSSTKRPPFYAGAANGGGGGGGGDDKQVPKSPDVLTTNRSEQDADNESDTDNDEASLASGRDRGSSNEPGNDIDDDEEPISEPKRVGDDDVDEEGDTVLVEPKSDGVDDDPPLPGEEGNDGSDDGSAGGTTVDSKQERPLQRDEDDRSPSTSTEMVPTKEEGENSRGNRVNRDRPNSFTNSGGQGQDAGGDSDDNDADDAKSTGGQAVGAGGGIGATIGGRGGDSGNGSGTADRKGKPEIAGSGVEFANEDDNNESANDNGGDGNNIATGKGDSGRPRSNKPDSVDDRQRGGADGGEFGDRRTEQASGRSPDGLGNGSGSGAANDNADTNDANDLDYRDEMADSGRGSGGNRPATGGRKDHQDKEDESNGLNKIDGMHGGAKSKEHCDDSSYSHHDDHQADHHHDTSDWLRGSIPGEPDDDYPILSRVNVTNFNCNDHRHPGYYADVESRCQIFHICQADGRQDSFLCPNGTIFSQKTLVCVWWNGFNCEDAPKFYYLNELLYKSANGDESPQSVAVPKLRPLGGTEATPTSRDLQPRGMMVAHGSTAAAADRDDRDDEPSSIEGLVKRMRGRKPHEAATSDSIGASGGGDSANSASDGGKRGNEATRGPTNGGSNFFGPNDEATIQRKSTNLDDESSGAVPEASGSPSRIRARDNIPRRKRRASARQAPPKLKSRRISRNSRRRKLRHGIKPRRRA